jgi:hypothetical protein
VAGNSGSKEQLLSVGILAAVGKQLTDRLKVCQLSAAETPSAAGLLRRFS